MADTTRCPPSSLVGERTLLKGNSMSCRPLARLRPRFPVLSNAQALCCHSPEAHPKSRPGDALGSHRCVGSVPGVRDFVWMRYRALGTIASAVRTSSAGLDPSKGFIHPYSVFAVGLT